MNAMIARIHGVTRGWGRRALLLLVAVTVLLALPLVAPQPAHAADMAALKAQLAALRKDVQAAADAWDAAQTRLETTQARIKAVDARMKVEANNLTKAQTVLANRADAMYRGGGDTTMVEFVLGATTWEDFVSRLDYVTIIASSDAQLIQTVKETSARLERNKRDYKEALVSQAQDAATAKTQTDAMDAAFAAKKSQYDKVLADIAAEWARTHPKGGGSYPPGPNGMVFPVQGPCAYSDTWGAPRSGGRRHKGTDIMASRGVPCVATTAGYVNAHSSGLGGKSITLTGDNGWTFYYAHLNGYAVRSGHVKAGQLIGYVGNTGNAAGGPCHLHFQMGPHGNWVDPYPYLKKMQ
jgi:murein DD-endopeptidase MepM/ murein hydrolase activator NlpD